MCAANVSPVWIVQPVRRLMDSCRAINEIVFALLFVVAVGLGPFAGVMALFVHNLSAFAPNCSRKRSRPLIRGRWKAFAPQARSVFRQ